MDKLKPIAFTNYVLLLLGLMYTCCVSAQEKSEAPIELPAMTQNYVHFYSSPELEFTIDLDSISLPAGEESEVRYTLKATSKQGAVNISYEGIRCDKRQKIIYAIGRDDGEWTRVRSPQWKPIQKSFINLQQATLADEFFCDVNTLSGNLKSIWNRIKWNRPFRY